jgi:hypothetical protein
MKRAMGAAIRPLPLRGQTRNAPRVLRGGAFNNNPRNVRCAYRNNNDPDNRNDNIGFRVVLSTFAAGIVRRALPCGPRQMAGSGPGRVPSADGPGK